MSFFARTYNQRAARTNSKNLSSEVRSDSSDEDKKIKDAKRPENLVSLVSYYTIYVMNIMTNHGKNNSWDFNPFIYGMIHHYPFIM